MSERIPSLFIFFRTTKQRTKKKTTPGLLQKHLYFSRWQNDPKSTPVSGDVSPAWCNGARNGIVNTFSSLSHLGLLFTPLTPLLKFRTNTAERDPVRNTHFPLLAHTATHVFNTHVLRGSVFYMCACGTYSLLFRHSLRKMWLFRKVNNKREKSVSKTMMWRLLLLLIFLFSFAALLPGVTQEIRVACESEFVFKIAAAQIDLSNKRV